MPKRKKPPSRAGQGEKKLGVIYARGLGVSRDIKKGAEYLQKAGSLPEAGEELSRYKKTLFGKWVEKK